MTEITPKMLDWTIHGFPVYLYRRKNDSVVYASIHDFTRFRAEPLAIVRVPVANLKAESDVLEHESVKAKIAELSKVE